MAGKTGLQAPISHAISTIFAYSITQSSFRVNHPKRPFLVQAFSLSFQSCVSISIAITKGGEPSILSRSGDGGRSRVPAGFTAIVPAFGTASILGRLAAASILNLLGLLARGVELAQAVGEAIPGFFTLGAMACCAGVAARVKVLCLSQQSIVSHRKACTCRGVGLTWGIPDASNARSSHLRYCTCLLWEYMLADASSIGYLPADASLTSGCTGRSS